MILFKLRNVFLQNKITRGQQEFVVNIFREIGSGMAIASLLQLLIESDFNNNVDLALLVVIILWYIGFNISKNIKYD